MKVLARKEEAHKKLLEGAKLMYDFVGTTLSPKGRNIGLQMPWGTDNIVHDGVSVAREVESDDELVQMGITYIKQAAEKTVSECGDATTTTTILAYEIIKRGFEIIDRKEKPFNAMVLRKQLQNSLPQLLEAVKKITKEVKTQTDIEKVATISAQEDSIGKLIGEAAFKLGKEGLLSVDMAQTVDTTLEYTRGMQWDKGYTSPYFITDITRMEAVVRNPYVLVLGKRITSIPEILPVVYSVKKLDSTCPLIIIGEVGGLALEFFVKNKVEGNLTGCIVDVPGMEERKKNNLIDVAYYTGATFVTDQVSIDAPINDPNNVPAFDVSLLGRVKTAIVSQNQISLIEGKGDKTNIENHVNSLKETQKNVKTDYEREILTERIAKLTTGAAIIRVGGKTELEQKDRLERVKDAVGAAQAAVKEGIVPGGGLAFLRIREQLPMKAKRNEGEQILFEVLGSIIYKILENSGMTEDEANKIVMQVVEKPENIGYNVMTEKLENLEKSGVIDPAMAIRLSVENAISIGAAIITCDGLIARKTIKNPAVELA